MIHVRTSSGVVVDESTTIYEIFCVGCGKYVSTETGDFITYLVGSGQVCYCDDCDPLPDESPACLKGDRITVGGTTFDVRESVRLGFPLVLFTTQSYT